MEDYPNSSLPGINGVLAQTLMGPGFNGRLAKH